jgi:group I intron endonuclease
LQYYRSYRTKNKNLLLEKEQFYINSLKPEFNVCTLAGSCLGVKRSETFKINKSLSQIGDKNHFYGKKHSDETKQKMRDKSTGRKHSDESKEKLSESRKNKYKGTKNPFSKFNEEQIKQIRQMRKEGMLLKEIGEIFNSPRQTIASIISRKTYAEVE